MRKRLKVEAEELAQSIEIYVRGHKDKYLYPMQIMRKFGVDIGSVRRAIKLMHDKGLIQQCSRENWAFGSVLRGARRSWRLKDG
jgi:ribosomal protein S25